MKTNNKPFMESYRNMFEVGDIVWWSEWDLVENLGYTSTVFYGAIIEIKIKKNLNNERSVYVAEILPFGQTKTRELSLHLLNKRTS
tara:strand:+ start:2221 stop:2478 length:258 start_codon:yes stop_codon:yes gene_type:complete